MNGLLRERREVDLGTFDKGWREKEKDFATYRCRRHRRRRWREDFVRRRFRCVVMERKVWKTHHWDFINLCLIDFT